MSIQLLDGKGRGYSVGIDAENRMLVRSASKPESSFTALVSGKTFFFPTNFQTFELESESEEAGLLYIQYTGTNRFIIENIRLSVDLSSQIRIYRSPDSMTNVTSGSPVNTNLTSGNVFSGTFSIGGSNSVLSGGSLAQQILIGTGSNSVMDFHGSLILGQNDTIAVTIQSDVGSGVSILAGASVTGYEAEAIE